MSYFSFLKNKGISLFELMITLLIIAGLTLIFMPLGESFFSRNALEHRTNTIIEAIKFAKNKSQLDDKPLILSEISDQDGWSTGMQLFIDNTGNYKYGHGDQLIKRWTWRRTSSTVEWHGFSSDHYLLFNGAIKNSALNGYFSLKQNDVIKAKIILNRLGRVRIERYS